MAFDGSIVRNCLDRPPHGISRDTIFRSEFALSWKPAGRSPLAGGNAFAQGAFNFDCNHLGQD